MTITRASALARQISPRSLRHLLILDFEATCGDSVPPDEQEIIEFPTLLYDIKEAKVLAEFHGYVKPTRHPVLTDFCTTLTGITQETVDSADTFPAVWSRFNEFLKVHNVFRDPAPYAFLTCGHWDLRHMLPAQHAYYLAKEPTLAPLDPIFSRWINVKVAFRKHYKKKQNKSMTSMLSQLQLPLEGKHHSGIDDCRNIARIVERMQKDGWKPSSSDLWEPKS
ncbi:3'-5' exoribonuclease 1 [Hypsizygus marmoreus]|uniref:3'-5' exoribonuclease 1 n=1 Tax=Hypsizygus marmoreus TaxID=39966 RepID=A0A369K4U1_HYPMA|nr:3'-5' exoribonuclease 1 [Hypsizygus marmoreus]